MNKLILGFCAVLALAGCTTQNHTSALPILTTVLGTASTTAGATTCTITVGSPEIEFPVFNPTQPGTGLGFTGFVVKNQLTDPSTLNTVLRANSTNFSPHQAVVEYEVVGVGTLPKQIIPTSGQSVVAGASAAVAVPLFSPLAILNALTPNTIVRTTTRIEGKLDDGSTVSTDEHDYVVQIVGGTAATTPCF
jgi:hypothetical protein